MNAQRKKAIKRIMHNAWGFAYKASLRFGGKKSEFFRAALKQAWADAKDVVVTLKQKLFKEWKGSRLYPASGVWYFHEMGIRVPSNAVSIHKIHSAKIVGRGDEIFTGETVCALRSLSFYFDLKTHEFVLYSKDNYSGSLPKINSEFDKLTDQILENIKQFFFL